MAPLFKERERAAENIYVHDEEVRFLARRRGIETLSDWASTAMGMTPDDAARYRQSMVDAFVSGTPEEALVTLIQTHLERAGKPALSTNVGTVLAQAVAAATLELRGTSVAPAPAATPDPRAEWERHHPKTTGSWGWSL